MDELINKVRTEFSGNVKEGELGKVVGDFVSNLRDLVNHERPPVVSARNEPVANNAVFSNGRDAIGSQVNQVKTAAEPKSIVQLEATIAGLDFDTVEAHPTLARALKTVVSDTLKNKFVKEFGIAWDPQQVTLRKGSVIVTISASVPESVNQAVLKLVSSNSGAVSAALMNSVASIPSISDGLESRTSHIQVVGLNAEISKEELGSDPLLGLPQNQADVLPTEDAAAPNYNEGINTTFAHALACTQRDLSGEACDDGKWVDSDDTHFFYTFDICSGWANKYGATCVEVCENYEGAANHNKCLCGENAICDAGQLCNAALDHPCTDAVAPPATIAIHSTAGVHRKDTEGVARATVKEHLSSYN